eukprot:3764628-Amphidinium_carterae.1
MMIVRCGMSTATEVSVDRWYPSCKMKAMQAGSGGSGDSNYGQLGSLGSERVLREPKHYSKVEPRRLESVI